MTSCEREDYFIPPGGNKMARCDHYELMAPRDRPCDCGGPCTDKREARLGLEKAELPNTSWLPGHALDGTELPKTDKPDWSLLPWDALEAVIAAFEDGRKHGNHNWALKPSSYAVHFAAAMRHLNEFWSGHDGPLSDSKHGATPLDGAIARLLFLRAYLLRGIGTDDRPYKRPQRSGGQGSTKRTPMFGD